MLGTFNAPTVEWQLAPTPIAEAIVDTVTESVDDLWEHLDQCCAALIERVPEYHAALRAFFLDLRTRIYGEKNE
ncbi:MAG: hypothetical protein K2Q23_10750 [Bryobacteraceae bacterium]|nr:hypothetical protein [Bryobacteraceae bacterium]